MLCLSAALDASTTLGIDTSISVQIIGPPSRHLYPLTLRCKHVELLDSYSEGTHKSAFSSQTIAQYERDFTSPREKTDSQVVGAITGHCGLNKHLANTGLSQGRICGLANPL